MFKVICKLWIESNINDVRHFWPCAHLIIKGCCMGAWRLEKNLNRVFYFISSTEEYVSIDFNMNYLKQQIHNFYAFIFVSIRFLIYPSMSLS